MDDEARAYIDGIPADRRPLFDRVHGLVLGEFPEADVRISYGIPTYVNGRMRLYVGSWKHGVSIYGFGNDRDGGFLAAHPDLHTGKGTIKLRAADAAAVPDDDLRALIRAALAE